MKRFIPILAVLVLATTFGTAWAARCLGIPETQIAWCDDFDNYCTTNNPSNPWPGYPPSPDTICATDGTAVADADFFRQNWPNVFIGDGADSMAPISSPISFSFANSMPMVAANQHGPISSQYHEYDMTSVLSRHHSNAFAVNGTDASPLKFKTYWRNSQVYGLNRSPFYIELRMGEDRAPTDYVWSGSCGEPYDCNCAHHHRDATCNATCVPAHCSAQHFCIDSICQTGPRQGLACTDNTGCWGCIGGPNNGGLCYDSIAEDGSDSYCPGTCSGGPRDGQSCSDDNTCGTCVSTCDVSGDCVEAPAATCNSGVCTNNLCVGGAHPGAACKGNADCGACVGGPRDTLTCTLDSQCIMGCVGGLKEGNVCTTDENCWACNGDGPKHGHACTQDSQCAVACNNDESCQKYCDTGEAAGCDMAGGPDDGKTCVHDSDCGILKYPIIPQQLNHVAITTPHPRPPWTKHASLAVGWLVAVQTNSCLDGNFPAAWHMNTFDGEKWIDLYYGVYIPCPGSQAEFDNANMSIDAWVTVEIKTATYKLTLESGDQTSCGTVARLYTGPFNMVAMGAGASCELNAVDSNDWSCKDEAERVPWAHPWPKDGYGGKQWPDGYIDSATLWDGVYVNPGACCHADGNCEEITSCQGEHDRYAGDSSTCENTKCCPYLFADADRDGDVDQIDFAAFQLCYTGTGGGVPPGCECWDQNNAGAGDGHIDADDFTEFNNCWTGPNVKYDDVVPPPTGCNP